MQALLTVVTSAWWWKTPNHLPLFRIPAGVTSSATHRPEAILELGAPDQPLFEVQFSLSDPDPNPAGTGQMQLERLFESIGHPLPLVVYYEQNRGTQPNFGGRNVSVSAERNPHSSLQTTVTSPSEFKAWFFEKEADESQEVREREMWSTKIGSSRSSAGC